MAGEVVKRNKFTRMSESRHLLLTSKPRYLNQSIIRVAIFLIAILCRLILVDVSVMQVKTEIDFIFDKQVKA